jgi:hypothetical protein
MPLCAGQEAAASTRQWTSVGVVSTASTLDLAVREEEPVPGADGAGEVG